MDLHSSFPWKIMAYPSTETEGWPEGESYRWKMTLPAASWWGRYYKLKYKYELAKLHDLQNRQTVLKYDMKTSSNSLTPAQTQLL